MHVRYRVAVLSLLFLGACARHSAIRAPALATSRGIQWLVDSLAQSAGCPRSGLPPIRGVAFPSMRFDSVQACGIATAALRRLALEPANEPLYAPGDTARVSAITIFVSAYQELDRKGRKVGIPDSVVQVEIDIVGRRRMVAVYYSAGSTRAERERFGTTHR